MKLKKKYQCTSDFTNTVDIIADYSDNDMAIEITEDRGGSYVYISKENAIDLANSILEYYKK